MKAICLGGAGRIARESLFDLVEFSDFEKITVADYDEAEGRKVAQWLNDPRVDFVRVDVTDHDAPASVLKGYDVALDGTTIRVSHGAFRPVAFSAATAETTRYEYDPNLPGRTVYEDGEYKQVPPFARPRDIALPAPYGTHPEYIIPHAETVTLSKALKDKGVRLIEVRGTWPPKNMQHILTHTHPASDGSEPGWEKLRAYTRNVGIPMAIGATVLARGKVAKTGVVTPEEAFDPKIIFAELKKRRLIIHEQKTELAG